MAQKGKIALKKWDFGGKKHVIGPEKWWAGDPNRKAKWCKMQVMFLKTDKAMDMKGYK